MGHRSTLFNLQSRTVVLVVGERTCVAAQRAGPHVVALAQRRGVAPQVAFERRTLKPDFLLDRL